MKDDRTLLLKMLHQASIHLPNLEMFTLIITASRGNKYITDTELTTNIETLVNAELIKKEFVPIEVANKYICLGCGELTDKDKEHFIPPKKVNMSSKSGQKHAYIPGQYTCIKPDF